MSASPDSSLRLVHLPLNPKTRRSVPVRQAVGSGMRRWQQCRQSLRAAEQSAGLPLTPASTADPRAVLGPMPRRPQITARAGRESDGLPRMRHRPVFKTSFAKVLARFARWLVASAFFFGGILWDTWRGQNTEEWRAVRLRQAFDRIGGTFIKLGQQMAARVDLLPYAYCAELSKLLDNVAPFPAGYAVQAVERVTGRPLADTFAVFDPEPIGSASIACVYQAVLKSGEKVAVKVRRPGIAEMFAADLRALDWGLGLLEFLGIVRPGFTKNPRLELRNTLLEELDFYKEARYQALFRREAKKSDLNFVTAPRVYFELSGGDVIVQEFVSGLWLSEVLTAVEYSDRRAQLTMRQMRIDPAVVARRLLRVSYWGLWETLYFHADPHPANILVQPDNKLVFIDFGSGGSFSRSRRVALHAINELERKDDIEGVARVSLTFMEPLPPIDIDEVLKEIEAEYLTALLGMRTREAEWWEKTSAQIWLAFFRVSSRHQIPLSVGTVRMLRATLLYDTLALRLDHSVDVRREYGKYRRRIGKSARKRVQNKFRRALNRGLDDMDYLRLEEAVDLGSRILYRTQRLLDSLSFNSVAMLSKPIFVLFEAFRFAVTSLVIIIAIVLGAALFQLVRGGSEATLGQTLGGIFSSGWFLLLIFALIVVNIRRIYLRLSDKD